MDDRALWTQLRSPVQSHGGTITVYSTPVTGWETPWFEKGFVTEQLDQLREQVKQLTGDGSEIDEMILACRKKFTYGFGASGNAFEWDDPMLLPDDDLDDVEDNA